MSHAREEVLARVRGALGDAPHVPDVPRGYRTGGEHAPGSPEAVEQLADRLEDYRARVLRVPAGDEAIGDAIAAALFELGIRDAIAAAGVPADWLRGLPRARTDDGSPTARELDQVPAVVTGSVTAVAETGTIILDGGPLCGRRAITLVPDVHICVVLAADVVQTVPEGLRLVDPARPLTLVSGPSATSDIELNRVEGVHGPRALIVVLAG